MKLVTPIRPRFVREGKRLIVSAPQTYLTFATSTIVSGLMIFALGCMGIFGIWSAFGRAIVILFAGIAVAVSGALAHLSLDFAEFDFQEHTYKRRLGSSIFRTLRRGNLNELQVLTFSSGIGSGLRAGRPVARLILYWKNGSQEPLTIYDDLISTSPSKEVPDFNSIQTYGGNVARALGVPYQMQSFQ